MKAFVYKKYGPPDVLQLAELIKPSPKDNEVLIKIHATTVTSADCRIRSLNVPRGFGLISRLVFGWTTPREPVLGVELAGKIELVGKGVSKFKVGDDVFAIAGMSMGCYAQYKCIPENGALAVMPSNLSYQEAAALPFGGTTALDFLRRGRLQTTERILINGASGSVGTAMVQLARHFGAEVTGVCSKGNMELVKSLGAHHVIDYTEEDFTKNGEIYDVVVDTVGTSPYVLCKNSLSKCGSLLLVVAGLPEMLASPWVAMTSSQKIIAGPVSESAEDLIILAKMAEAGEFKPVIDKLLPFAQIAEAHRYVDSGRKRGNVVISLENDDANLEES